MKSSRRNIGYDDAVQESFYLSKQFRTLLSAGLAESPVDLNQILRTLNVKRIPFLLIGAMSIGGWTGRPRATAGVDILVQKRRDQPRAVRALASIYRKLETCEVDEGVFFFIPGEKYHQIKVLRPCSPDLKELFRDAIRIVSDESAPRYRIPSLESTVASKYAAMRSRKRDVATRMMDAVDFDWMVIHSTDPGRKPIDLARLEFLGEKVWPGGGGKEILRLVDEVKAGKAINLDSLG
jgi:hypothetical protein